MFKHQHIKRPHARDFRRVVAQTLFNVCCLSNYASGSCAQHPKYPSIHKECCQLSVPRRFHQTQCSRCGIAVFIPSPHTYSPPQTAALFLTFIHHIYLQIHFRLTYFTIPHHIASDQSLSMEMEIHPPPQSILPNRKYFPNPFLVQFAIRAIQHKKMNSLYTKHTLTVQIMENALSLAGNVE